MRTVKIDGYQVAAQALASATGWTVDYSFDAGAKKHTIVLSGSGDFKAIKKTVRQFFPPRFSLTSFGNGSATYECILPQIVKHPAQATDETEAKALAEDVAAIEAEAAPDAVVAAEKPKKAKSKPKKKATKKAKETVAS